MKSVIDMNLPAAWVTIIEHAGWEEVHWSAVGYPKAKDTEIMAWAKENGCAVITLDLDYGEILAMTNASGPSVVQLRARHALEATNLAPYVVEALGKFADELERGAIVSIDFLLARRERSYCHSAHQNRKIICRVNELCEQLNPSPPERLETQSVLIDSGF